MDKRAAVNSRKSVVALRSMSVGVRKVSMALTVTNRGENSEIQKRLEVLRNENFEKGEDELPNSICFLAIVPHFPSHKHIKRRLIYSQKF